MNLITLLKKYIPEKDHEADQAGRIQRFVETDKRCFERSNPVGHITGSAWIVDPSGTKVLLVHHKKIGLWLQPGGHADGDSDVLRVAVREAREETGIEDLEIVSPDIFDVDIHQIPAYGPDPEHKHFDIRFALMAKSLSFKVSEESHALAWVELSDLKKYTNEESILRMARKWKSLWKAKNRG